MAGVKWSAFTAGSALTGADQFVGLESGVNVRWTLTQLQTFLSTNAFTALLSPSLKSTGAIAIGQSAASGSGDVRIQTGNSGVDNNNATVSFQRNSGTDGYVGTISGAFGLFDGGGTSRIAVGTTVTVAASTATPAAGSTTAVLLFGTTSGFGIYYGSNAPTVSAAQGSLYLRSNGTGVADRAYINTNGTTGWTAIATAG